MCPQVVQVGQGGPGEGSKDRVVAQGQNSEVPSGPRLSTRPELGTQVEKGKGGLQSWNRGPAGGSVRFRQVNLWVWRCVRARQDCEARAGLPDGGGGPSQGRGL